MEHTGKISAALNREGLKFGGVTALHETGTAATIFTTGCGKVYRVDWNGDMPSEAELAQAKAAIEAETGLVMDWHGATRTEAERAPELERLAEESRKQSAAETAAQKPIDTRPEAKKPADKRSA